MGAGAAAPRGVALSIADRLVTSPSGFSTIDCAWNEADAGVVQILHHLIGRRRRRRHSHPIGLFFLGFCFTESGFVSTAAEEEEEEEEEEENALRLVRDSFLIRACRRRRPPFSRAATGERRGRVCGTCAIAKSFVCFFFLQPTIEQKNTKTTTTTTSTTLSVGGRRGETPPAAA